MAVLPGASEAPAEQTPQIIFFTDDNSHALSASFRRFQDTFISRHPALAKGLRIDTASLPNDSAAALQRIREAAKRRPAMFVAHTGAHAQAVHAAAPHVPLVFSSHTDPRELGVTSSLGQHREAATGLWINDELNAKRLEVLLDAYVQLRVVAVLGDADWFYGIGDERTEMQALATQRGVDLRLMKADSVERAIALIESSASAAVQGWCIPRSSVSLDGRLVRRLSEKGVPVIAAFAQDVFEGANISYAYDRAHQSSMLVDLAARVLRGESPASIPVQTPERFQLVVRIADDPRLPPLNPAVVRRADLVVR